MRVGRGRFGNLHESPEVHQQRRILFDQVSSIFHDYRFDPREVSLLQPTYQAFFQSFLPKALKQESLDVFNQLLAQRSPLKRHIIEVSSEDFHSSECSRSLLYTIITQAYVSLHQDFVQNQLLNGRLNPRRFTDHTRISRKLFLYYFRRHPVSDEHIKLFAISQCSDVQEWLAVATGGLQPDSAFIVAILNILRHPRFFKRLTSLMKGRLSDYTKKELDKFELVVQGCQPTSLQIPIQVPPHKKQLEATLDALVQIILEFSAGRSINLIK